MGSLPASAALCNGFGHEQAIAEYIFAALLGRPVPLISGNSLTGFSLLDWLALIVFGFGWLGYELVMDRTAVRRRSLNVALDEHRHPAWCRDQGRGRTDPHPGPDHAMRT